MDHTLLGTRTVETGSSTGGVTVGADVPAGALVTVTAAWSNDSPEVPAVTNVTDSGSNAYGLDVAAGTGNTTVSCAIISAILSAPLEAGDTIDLTISGTRVRWLLQADAFTQVGALDQTGVNHNPGSSTSMSTGITQHTSTPNLLVACYGFGRGGGAVPALDPGWSGGPYVTTAAGSAERGLQMGYRTVSAAGPQEGTASLSVSAVYAGCIATYKLLGAAFAAPPRARPHLRNLLIR